MGSHGTLVSGPEYGAFMCEVFDAWAPDHVGTVSVRMFENIAQRATGGPPELCVFSPTCGNAVVLEANGDVYACDHFVPGLPLGQHHGDPIGELVRRAVPEAGPCQAQPAREVPRPARIRASATAAVPGSVRSGLTVLGDPALCEGYRAVFEHAYETIQAIGWRAVRGEPSFLRG